MPSSFRGKNKKKIWNMFLVSFFVFSAVFMFHIGTDVADVSGPGIGLMSAHAEQVSATDRLGAWMWDHTIGWAVNGPLFVVNVLLYMFLQLLSLVLVLATTVFGWAVNPAAAHNMLNMASVYTLWRMIRDFFNLFFILTILFIAFSTIFQVSAYNYKKLLWHLVLMALLVNFSFPVTRFIIDATNVPMYFFMENIFRDKSQAEATQLFGTVFSSTNLREILIPDFFEEVANVSNAKKMTLQLLTSVIFMFLFSMSLLVLALLFLVRLVMLTVLIIFSPVGYAGSAIPGFEKYAKQWWESLMKHAIFGPTAMLMLLVSITFLREFKVNQSVPTNSFSMFSKTLTSDQSQSDIISAMATSIVPIILIWTAISVGQMVGVQGAAGVTSWAQKTSKGLGRKFSGAGRKFSGVDSVQKNWKEYKKEREGRASAKFAANNWGAKLGKNLNSNLDKVSASRTKSFDWKDPSTYKNVASRETAQARQARLRYLNHDLEDVNKVAKDNLLEHKSDDQLRDDHDVALKKNDIKMVAATAAVMGTRNLEIDKDALDKIREKYGQVGNIESLVTKDVEKKIMPSDPEKVLTTVDASGKKTFNQAKFVEMIRKGQVDRDKIAAHGWTDNVVRFMNEEKKLDAKFLNDLSKKNPAAVEQIAKGIDTEITRMSKFTGSMTSEQQKSYDNLHVAHVNRTGDFHASATDSQKAAVFKKADVEVLKNMSSATLAIHAASIAQNMNAQQFGTTISKLAQDGKDVTDLLNEIQKRGEGQNADKIRNAIKTDNRLNTL